jgi:hypothetical protein
VHDADNDCAETIDAVERKVVADDKHSNIRCYLGARWPKLRMVAQTLAPSDDPVDEAVGSGRAVQRDMQPDIIEVGAGARRKYYAGHASAIGNSGRQTLTPAPLDIFGVKRLPLATFDAFSPEPP